MLEPQDLPGRYGRVIRALDRLLETVHGEAVVAGGWAVWRHGYLGRVTQDVDIVVPAGLIDELLRVAAVSGFEVLPTRAGGKGDRSNLPARPGGCFAQIGPVPFSAPILHHKESDVSVDILPEGATPGTPSKPAPTTIPHPSRLGAQVGSLKYIDLAGLVELKLAAGRARDESDVVELLRANPERADSIRQHLGSVHEQYTARFDELAARAREQTDR